MTAPDLTYNHFMRGKRFRLQYSPACMVADPDGVWVSLEDARDEVMRRATPAPAAMTPDVAKLVEAAEGLIGDMDMSDDDPDNAGWELYTYAGRFRRLAKALAALREGGDDQ